MERCTDCWAEAIILSTSLILAKNCELDASSVDESMWQFLPFVKFLADSKGLSLKLQLKNYVGLKRLGMIAIQPTEELSTPVQAQIDHLTVSKEKATD